MNYFGHVALACKFQQSAAFLLGSMLPDFASIVRCRTPSSRHELVSQGVAFHHVSDSSFHDLLEFRVMLRESVANLRSLGVRKGAASAAAHIGIELLLDASLASSAEHRAAFREALAIGSPKLLGGELNWLDDDGPNRFEDLRLRLLERSSTKDAYSVQRIAVRLVYALASRPRLSLTDDERPWVAEWLLATAPRVEDRYPTLWRTLVRRVSSQWSAGTRG